jgi:hypothetical protein
MMIGEDVPLVIDNESGTDTPSWVHMQERIPLETNSVDVGNTGLDFSYRRNYIVVP